jgi:hypothetical protein
MAAIAPAALASSDPWLRAESDNFIIYSNSSEARLRDLAADLESYDALLARWTNASGPRSPIKLEVFLFRVASVFYEALGSVSPGILGFYTARPELIASIAQDRGVEGFAAQTTLFHEYAHHFMFAHFANAYPAWYIEGFAELASGTSFEPNRVIIGNAATARNDTLSRGSWLPLQRLLTIGPGDFHSGEDEDKFYAQSWLLTHYIFFTPGMDAKFRDYVAAWRQGGDPVGIFAQHFGKSVTDFEADVRDYFHRGVHALALTRPAAVTHGQTAISPMPDSTGNLIALTVRLRGGVRAADAPALLQLVHSRVGSEPSDSFALMTLARAEATIGDRERARALLQPYIATHPNDVEATFLMGLSFLNDAEADQGEAKTAALTQARHYFVAAYRLNENYVPALYRYAATFEGQPMTETAMQNTANVILLAHQLAPQVSSIGFMAAEYLMSLDRAAEAVPILRAIAYDPHGGDGAKQARDLLQQAEAAAAQQVAATARAPGAQH